MVPGQCYEFGPFRLSERALLRDGRRVALTPKVLETLLVLVEAEGSVISKDELMRRVWPDTFVDETSLTSNISVLRKTLSAEAGGGSYVETIPKRGYRFVAPVVLVENVTVQDRLARAGGPSHRRRLRVVLPILLAAALAAAGLLGWTRFRNHSSNLQTRVMVAVLPVQNLSGDSERDYIADGLTEEIIAQLSRYNPKRLGVIALTSSMSYKGTRKTVKQIGSELGVGFVVESSLSADGDHIRISSQLVHVADQTAVWAADYNRPLHDLMLLQDEVATAIALHVQVEIATVARARLSMARPRNPDAYLAYVEGRYYWNKRSPESLERAIVHLQQAVQLDPTYALAYAGLADAYASQCLIADVAPAEVFPKAKAAALRALELDGELAEAHTSLAYLKFWYDWDWVGAEAEFQRALELNPGYATAHQWYAEYLRTMGRQEEAIAENRKALELDPLSLIMNMESGLPFYLERKFDEAIRFFKKTVEMDPDFGLAHCVLGWAYDGKSQYPEAIAELETALKLDDSAPVLSALAHAYASAGRQKDANRIVRQLRKRAETHYVSPFFLATIYAGMNQNERALDALDDTYSHHDWVLPWVNVALTLEPLRSEPRFLDLLERMKFPSRPGILLPLTRRDTSETFTSENVPVPTQP